MAETLDLTIHVPHKEQVELLYHTNIEIFVWSKDAGGNGKKVLSTMTNHFPKKVRIEIPEEYIKNLKEHTEMPDEKSHHIRIKAMVFHHPSGDLVASTYGYVILESIPFNQNQNIFVQSNQPTNINVKVFLFFRTKKHNPRAATIVYKLWLFSAKTKVFSRMLRFILI